MGGNRLFILKENIKIGRPIIFLCGPYYNPNDKSDRRKILKEYIHKKYKNILTLIIDDFLTIENIKDKEINIQLMEEIFASISSKTYIFLDTNSTSAELGLFANNSFCNSIKIYLPRKEEIISTDSIGFFISDIILKQQKDRIDKVYYRPKIIRFPMASDYVKEYYGFINDCIPKELIDDLQNDLSQNKLNCDIDVKFIKVVDGIIDYNVVNKGGNIVYVLDENSITFTISIKLLFYIVLAITYSEFYNKNLNSKRTNVDFTNSQITQVCKMIKECLLNTYLKQEKKFTTDIKKVEINTKIEKNCDDIIKHMLKFIFVYHTYAKYYGFRLIENYSSIVDKHINEENPLVIFEFNKKEIEIIKDINKDITKYLRKTVIITNRKKREIVTYKSDKNGIALKKIHYKMVKILNEKYNFFDKSFAYKKNSNIVKCVKSHIESSHFIKYDIKKFFNSIDKSILIKAISNELGIDFKKYNEEINFIFSICFYESRLPLGLVTSPILSDIYMKNFDLQFNKYLSTYTHEIKYTRYADDILISSEDTLSDTELSDLEKVIENLLSKLHLNINSKKNRKINLLSEGDHFKFLGINIVKGRSENYLTVGKNRINKISKMYLRYINNKYNMTDRDVFYTQKRIIGQIAFLNQVEGIEGYNKVKSRIFKCSKGKIILGEDRITFDVE